MLSSELIGVEPNYYNAERQNQRPAMNKFTEVLCFFNRSSFGARTLQLPSLKGRRHYLFT